MAGLTLVVVALHWLVLQAASLRLSLQPAADAAGQKSFMTRSITPPAPPAAEPAPATVAAAPPRPAPKPRPPPAARPKTEPVPAELPTPAPPATPEPAAEQTPPAMAESVPDTSLAALTSTVATITPTAPEPTVSAAAPSSTPSAGSPTSPGEPQATVVTAINLPASARLQYRMTGTSKGLTYHADAELAWKHSGSQYEAQMRVSAFLMGSRSMSSTGQVTAGGLAPTRFSDRSRSERAAHFEVDKGKITFSANTPDAPWLEGAQDRVSVFFQLGGMLAALPARPAEGSSITIYTVGPSDAVNWTFVLEAEEQLNLPAGDLATLKMTRKPRREYDQKVEIWYAPSLGYLPVRNRITQANGDFVDQQLKSVVKP